MSFIPAQDQIDAALDHAGRCAPLESCGVIVKGRFVPVDNLATDPGHFVMNRRQFCRIDADHQVAAIVHSHVHFTPIGGDADRAGCNATGLPWLIVSWPRGTWCVMEPDTSRMPLVGRPWLWGVNDCFGLVRDAFRSYTGIELRDYERDWLFWKSSEDIITPRIEENDFRRLPRNTTPRHCDLFVMKVGASIPNHLALFIEPDLILHQLYRRPSIRELYNDQWRQRTVFHLRHGRFA